MIATGATRKIAMLGNHVPRQCGIATFATDLSDAITAEFSEFDCLVVAMNDAGRPPTPREFASRSPKAISRHKRPNGTSARARGARP